MVVFILSAWLFSLLLWGRLAYVLTYHPFLRRRPDTAPARLARLLLSPVHFFVTWQPFPPVFHSRVYSLVKDYDKHPQLSSRLLARTKTHRLQKAAVRWWDAPPDQRAVSLIAARLTDIDSQQHIVRFMVSDPQLLRSLALRHLGPGRSALTTTPASPTHDRPTFVGMISALSSSPAASYVATLDLDYETGMDLMWWISMHREHHPLMERWPTAVGDPTRVLHLVQTIATEPTVKEAIMAVEGYAPVDVRGWDVVFLTAIEGCTTRSDLESVRELLATNVHLIETTAKLLSSGAPRDLGDLFTVAAALDAGNSGTLS